MIIRHSLQLLEQLSELEAYIEHWERIAQSQGVNLDSDALLKIALADFSRRNPNTAPPLTGHRKVS